ncbi:hypothetical protein PC123_g13771 [Phytophthora cactorum]|nr:hypothetical protein PC123_g13771 [Phytophthora cactorum]
MTGFDFPALPLEPLQVLPLVSLLEPLQALPLEPLLEPLPEPLQVLPLEPLLEPLLVFDLEQLLPQKGHSLSMNKFIFELSAGTTNTFPERSRLASAAPVWIVMLSPASSFNTLIGPYVMLVSASRSLFKELLIWS